MRKLVFIKSHFQKFGGLEKQARMILDALLQKGYDITVLTGQNTAAIAGAKVVSLEIPPKGFVGITRFNRACTYYLLNNPHDTVFSMDRVSCATHLRAGNGVHAAFLAARAAYSSPLKRLSFRFNPLHRAILDLEKKSLQNPALCQIIVNSHMVKEEILRYYPKTTANISVIHNGAPRLACSESFAIWPQIKEQTVRKYTLPANCFHFLFIGNDYRRKGLIPLLRALANLKGEPFHLCVLGKDKNPGYYIALAKKLGLAGKCSFLMHTQDTAPFYSLADALAVPSYYDPFANVTTEALSMGVRVISSKLNGGSEIITPENGLIYADNLKAALKAAISQPKTRERALTIRESVCYLDQEKQLQELIKLI